MNNLSNNRKGSFNSVFKRELDRLISRKLYLGVCLIIPLFCLFFISTIFGNGQMQNISIGIVDLDQTSMSRDIVRTVSKTTTFKVTETFTDIISARKATQKTTIYGYLVIPHNFEKDVIAGKQASLSYYYHYALLSVGTEVFGAFESLLEPLSLGPIVEQAVDLGMQEDQIVNFLVPINTQSHPLYNSSLDYSIYLVHPFFYIMFQVTILLVTIYVIGSEIKFKTALDWLKLANNNIFIAIAGKLLPYTIIFCLLGVFSNYIIFGVLNIPFSCGFLSLNLITILFTVATEGFGVFIFCLFPAIAIIISVVSMVGSLAATLSGVTFPTPFMYPPVYYSSFLFPIRHFVVINQNLLYGNYGLIYVWWHIVCLILFPLIGILFLPRLKKAVFSCKYENIE